MLSPVITAQPAQVTLTLDPGLTRRHDSLRDIVKTGIYREGLTRMAAELHIPAGNLSHQINGSASRHLSVDTLEAYLASTGDVLPIHYLVEKFLLSRDGDQAAALAQAGRLFQELQPLLKRAGL